MTNPHHIRRSLRQQRRNLPAATRHEAAQQAATLLINHPFYQTSYTIAGYIADDGELDPQAIMEHALAQQKKCYLPVCDSTAHSLLFFSYHDQDKLTNNQYGIPEPDQSTHSIAASALDCVIVPLVAFDAEGRRLGRGKGYYDRSFAFKRPQPATEKPYLIGLGYEFQGLNNIMTKPHDIPLDAIVTEQRIIEITPSP